VVENGRVLSTENLSTRLGGECHILRLPAMRVRNIERIARMTPIEQKLFDRIMELAADYEDGETGTTACIKMACGSLGLLDNDVAEWASRQAFIQGASEAGIPMSVIEGKTKLSDHFSQEYIDKQRNKLVR
jgi:hypothetical protein